MKVRNSFWMLLLALAVAAQTPAPAPTGDAFMTRLVAAAVARADLPVRYVSDYVRIPYPNGDVPADTGVCADEIIRVYRALGIDLQKEVHEDMVRALGEYPKKWHRPGRGTDSNIDHRRVPNLMVFFRRNGESLATSIRAEDYLPGDIVAWDLGHGLTHIGIVVDRRSPWFNRYMILHNIGPGPKIEDVLLDWKIIGHYRYTGPKPPISPAAPTRSGE
jgi:uncharacterized protein YijF (DUF1287 family)